MATTAKKLMRWLATQQDDAIIAVDDGGLALVVVDSDDYYEVGCLPGEDDVGLCDECKVEHHDVCGMKHGCRCCSDTKF